MTAAPELARFIRERRAEILSAWADQLTALPDARGLSRPALLDHVHHVLATVADLVASPDDEWPPHPGRPAAVDPHVLTRIEIGAGLPLVIAEMALLRRTIEHLWLAAGGSADAGPGALGHLARAIDAVMVDSVRRFVHVRVQLFETLERIVVAAESRRVDEFLAELIDVARGTIASLHTMAILVREGDLLRVRAAHGLEREVEQGTTLAVGEGFAGLVAAERRPVLIADASTDPLVRSPILRGAGIRALYGVPLLAPDEHGGAVIGVAHMGRRDGGDFAEDAKTAFRIIASRAAVLVHHALLRERLEEERTRFSSFVNNSPALMFMKDLEGRFTFMCREARRLIGRPPEDFVGRTSREVYPPEVAEALERGDRRVLQSRSALESENTIPVPGGPPRTFLSIKFPILDPRGELRGVGGVATDITGRKRHEEAQRLLARAGALLGSSLDLEATLTTLADLVVPSLADCCVLDMVEEDGSIRRLRVVHADAARADTARALHDLPLDRARPHLASAVFQARRSVFMPEIPPGYLDTIGQTPAHRRLLEELAPRAMIQVPFLARGRLLGALVLIASSEWRRYGREELTLAEDLARMASLAVDNARLYAAAQQAVRARDEVLAVVAHDLRNPLNVVVSAITGVLGGAPDADPAAQRRRLELGLTGARRAGRLTNDLLDVARIEAGRLSVRPTPRDPGRLLEDAAEALRPLGAEAGVELRVEAAERLPPVTADADRVLQVLDNLTTNAVRFTPRGGRVLLRAEAEPPLVRFVVQDPGPGIPLDERARVFERFWQGRRASRRGAGLGLPIARGIVEAHGGTIWIEAPPGGGTRVCFTLPAAREG